MVRTLSSSTTFFWKFIFPTIFFSLFMFAFFAIYNSEGLEEAVPLLIGPTLALFLFYFFLLKIKEVKIEKNYLLISNFREIIKVNIKDVKHISENRFSNPRIVKITFKQETQFGKSITFMATMKIFLFAIEPHPIVRELKGIVEYHKSR